MDKQSRREASKAAKEQKKEGGLYRIHNTVTGWQSEIHITPNIKGKINSFAFAVKTGSCVDLSLTEQWRTYGADAFALVEVERLTQKPDQDGRAFLEELAALKAMHEEQV